MQNAKKGDYVVRKSHNKDTLFIIDKIIKLNDGREIAILKGVVIRLQADAPMEDLEIADRYIVKKDINNLVEKINYHAEKEKRVQSKVRTGLILHLDGECIILEKIEENAYQAYPIADLSILKLSCINQ